ncbi:MAG: M23 family metallopeptidase [Spirochaetales bacterium]|nr:M23 family metallopeptidase [Spirochaetales bacterium]
MKKIVVLFLSFLMFFSLNAATAAFQSENYTLSVKYNDTITPGDAIFVRMNISIPKNNKKKYDTNQFKATLQLIQDGKNVLDKAPFYSITKNKKTQPTEFLCGIPVSLWLTTEGNYSLKVIFSISEDEVQEFILPSTYKNREFNKEVIELNEANTAIKTDTSPERTAQIEKLNDILFSYLSNDIFSLKKFTTPTVSQRYTAYCGDRRVYAYSNGKSSTSLHYGNDYGVPTGTEVHACSDGKVVLAENRISTGYSVVIEHLPGLYSLYYHLSELKVEEGQMVKQGELIGKSGATGLATGPHLHWEVRLNGSAVVPEFFLKDFTFEDE